MSWMRLGSRSRHALSAAGIPLEIERSDKRNARWERGLSQYRESGKEMQVARLVDTSSASTRSAVSRMD